MKLTWTKHSRHSLCPCIPRSSTGPFWELNDGLNSTLSFLSTIIHTCIINNLNLTQLITRPNSTQHLNLVNNTTFRSLQLYMHAQHHVRIFSHCLCFQTNTQMNKEICDQTNYEFMLKK